MYLFKFMALLHFCFSWLHHQSFELSSVGGGQPIRVGRYLKGWELNPLAPPYLDVYY